MYVKIKKLFLLFRKKINFFTYFEAKDKLYYNK